ncbi:MAG: hypothetical protein Q8Q91_01440, partial [Candidatus Daviesbacteria bacterium]|nr:hypothetical protein [Candidatus Daviesbacteria bacterium]
AVPFAGKILNNAQACMSSLITDGELKTGFTTVTNVLTSIYFSGSAQGVTVCFLPQSKSQQRDPNAKYDASGVAATGCLSQTSTGSTCYWCSQ